MAQEAPEEEKKENVKNIDQIELKNDTTTVCIHPFGATVTSWKVDDEEQLFVSSKAKWDQSKAIRGGIPLVFPQFGPGPMKQHGFARVCVWNLEKADTKSAVLSLSDLDLSDEWKKQFVYKFKLEYRIEIVDNNLCTKLSIINNEKDKSFQFTALFHTYFKVDSKSIKVFGLKGLNFNDLLEQNKNAQIKKEDNDKVEIDSETDRIYMDINGQDIVLIDETKQKYPVITIKTNFVDVVVWNPFQEKSKRMSDFGDNEYQQMVCIEPGSVAKYVTLKPGESKVYTQMLIPSKI